MDLIGFQHNYSTRANLLQRFTPSLLNRVLMLEEVLRPAGRQLFLYSPHEVRPDGARVPGFLWTGRGFARTEQVVPLVNGNWTHRTRRLLDRKGMGYLEFKRWCAERQRAVYVPLGLSELLANKLETYKLIRGYHEDLHPRCERFGHRLDQLEHFVATGRTTFIKPRGGSKGERIVTVQRNPEGLQVTRYSHGEQRRERMADLRRVLAVVAQMTGRKGNFVIQHGVDTLRYGECSFDIRVTMLHDGEAWHWLHEARVSQAGSDVSNVSQGGGIRPTEELLEEVMGAGGGAGLLAQLREVSFGLAAWIERLHPGQVMELAFDFVVDGEARLRLLEANTKPGLAGIGADLHLAEMAPEHQAARERWVRPHGLYLGRFLLSRSQGPVSGGPG